MTDRARRLRVGMAAGGTGGHLMPALALAEALSERCECEFLFLGSRRETERGLRRLVPYPVVELDVEGLAGVGLVRLVRRALRLPRAVYQSRRHLARFQPHLLVAAGGFVCGPAGVAAWWLRVPVLALEQNVVPGRTTRWLLPFVDLVAVSFPETRERLGPKARLTGNPVRRRIRGCRPADADDGAAVRRPSEDRPLELLVLGGSQGAHGLNELVRGALPHLVAAGIPLHVVHQSGERDVARLRAAYAEHGLDADVLPFIEDMAAAYRRAELAVCRAGATTIAELACCGLPAVLVPFPGATDDHQTANAGALVRAGAAELVRESDGPRALAERVARLAMDPAVLQDMRSRALSCDPGEAEAEVAELALTLATRRHQDDRNTAEPLVDRRPRS